MNTINRTSARMNRMFGNLYFTDRTARAVFKNKRSLSIFTKRSVKILNVRFLSYNLQNNPLLPHISNVRFLSSSVENNPQKNKRKKNRKKKVLCWSSVLFLYFIYRIDNKHSE